MLRDEVRRRHYIPNVSGRPTIARDGILFRTSAAEAATSRLL